MQNQIQTFQFQLNQSVRVEMKDGEPYFSLSDVAEILEIPRTSDLLQVRKDVVKNDTLAKRGSLNPNGVEKISVSTAGGKQVLTFINEPNLYRVIFRSNKQEAVKFQDWIFEKVIPQIRKTGSYSVSGQPAAAPRINEEQYARLIALCVVWSNANPQNYGFCISHTVLSDHIRELERKLGNRPLTELDTDDYAKAVDYMADKILTYSRYNRHPFQKLLKKDLSQTLAEIAEALKPQQAVLPPCKSRAALPPALKHKDCSIGSLLLGYGSGNPNGSDAEIALQDMAEIQSVFTRLTYAASAEKQLSQKDLQEIKSANDSLNFLSFMVMEAAAEALKH